MIRRPLVPPAWIRAHWAALAVLVIAAAMIVTMRVEGRVWFCSCWQVMVWVADAYSPHTSQHLLDPYSWTHLQHGLLFFWALVWLAPRWSWQTRLVAATVVEALWEIVENSPWVIARYREATAALGYEGDSVVNSVGDLLACAAGFAIAGRIGLRGTVALFIAIEAALAWWIRDTLLLNVVMLFYPIESIKQWQMAL